VIPEIIARASEHVDRVAVVDDGGEHTYRDLLDTSAEAAAVLLAGLTDLDEARVVFMLLPGFDYARVQWAIWRAGGVAVPLCLTHPEPELAYMLDDAQPVTVVTAPEYQETLRSLTGKRGIRLLGLEDLNARHIGPLPAIAEDRRAMILYTSGTTGQPKGVVSTHRNLTAQVRSLVEAWGWTREDRILLSLPLHHLHGILNVVCCALWSGAVCEMLPKFDASRVWDRLASGELTTYMGVPTLYHRLIEKWDATADTAERSRLTAGCRQMRLMVSGSAALPIPVLERWHEISGHTLLERYGMTEIGMALSNPLLGERRPGSVGSPLPGVEVQMVDEQNREVGEGEAGEIQVRGDTVFLEYWNQPDATSEAFTADGWFRTGDVAVKDDEAYRILGRSSIDIIKSGAEKISALEVEEALLRHAEVREVAVVGIPDPEWGQKVVALVVPAANSKPSVDELREWCRSSLARYKIPKEVHLVDSLPRNPMGKVVKPDLVREWSGG
jgi:malonyl-CoA/methylmalonyl-CoA synthetase